MADLKRTLITTGSANTEKLGNISLPNINVDPGKGTEGLAKQIGRAVDTVIDAKYVKEKGAQDRKVLSMNALSNEQIQEAKIAVRELPPEERLDAFKITTYYSIMLM